MTGSKSSGSVIRPLGWMMGIFAVVCFLRHHQAV